MCALSVAVLEAGALTAQPRHGIGFESARIFCD